MGPDSDLPIMKQAAEILDQFGIDYEIRKKIIQYKNMLRDQVMEKTKSAITKPLTTNKNEF